MRSTSLLVDSSLFTSMDFLGVGPTSRQLSRGLPVSVGNATLLDPGRPPIVNHSDRLQSGGDVGLLSPIQSIGHVVHQLVGILAQKLLVARRDFERSLDSFLR